MTDGITVDTSQLQRLAADLGRAPGRLQPQVEATLKRGAQNIKDAYVAQARGSRHFKGMAGSFAYDRFGFARTIGYRVGPDKNREGGALGNVFFFGTSRGGGSGDLTGPLEAEVVPVTQALERAMRGIL